MVFLGIVTSGLHLLGEAYQREGAHSSGLCAEGWTECVSLMGLNSQCAELSQSVFTYNRCCLRMVVSHGSIFEEEEKDYLDRPKGFAGWKHFNAFVY